MTETITTPPPRPTMTLREAARRVNAEHSRIPNILASEPSPNRRHSLSLAELLAQHIPEATWALDSYIPSEGLVMLAAPEKRGKSLLCIQLGLCIAAGLMVLGKAVTRTPVLLVEEEGGRRRFQDRIRRAAAGLGINPDDTPLHTLHRRGLRIDTPDGIAWLRDEVVRTGARVVIVGPISQSMGIADENKASDVNLVVRDYLQPLISDLGIVVCLVHHANKAATAGGGQPASVAEAVNGIRGANAWAAAMDSVIVMHRSPEDDKGILFVMSRDGESFKQHYEMDWATYLAHPIESQTQNRGNEQTRMLGLIVTHGTRKIRDLMPEFPGLSDDAIRTRLNNLINLRFVEAKQDPSDGKRTLLYSATEAGAQTVANHPDEGDEQPQDIATVAAQE